VVFTTSAIAVSEAFGNMPYVSVRTPLHAPLPLVGPLSPPGTRTTDSLASSLSQEFQSFLSSSRGSSNSDRDGLLIQNNNRYGGRATVYTKGLKTSRGSASNSVSSISADAADYNYNYDKGKLGFDLKMVSSSSMDSTSIDIEDNAGPGSSLGLHARKVSDASMSRFEFKIDKLNPSSPIKKRMASNLRPREHDQYSGTYQVNVSDFFENGNGKVLTAVGKSSSSGSKNSNVNGNDIATEKKSKSSTVPGWFPYTPTRSQIERLKVVELKDACGERGLHKSGKKIELQNRLLEWTNNQHRRRVLERNAMHTSTSTGGGIGDPLQDAINNAVFRSRSQFLDNMSASKFTSAQTQTQTQTPECSINMDGTIDCVEPLINRRKALLRAKKFSFSKTKRSLGFDIDEEYDADTDVSLSMSSSPMDMELPPTSQFLSDLKRTFDKDVTTRKNNYQVKELYQDAKHADQAGDYEAAKFYLNQLRVVTPEDTRVIRRLARLEVQEGNVHKAREILKSGLRSMPQDANLLQGLGQWEVKFGNTQNARNFFHDAIKASPRFANPYHALGTLEHSVGNIKVATTVLRLGLKNCPSNHRLHHALGDLYREAKMLDMAEKAYNKGLKCIQAEAESTGRSTHHWGQSFFYSAMSYLAYDRGSIDESKTWLRKSVDLVGNRMHSQGWLGLAQLEESEMNIDKSRDVYKEAISAYEQKRGIEAYRASGQKNLVKPAKLGDKWIDVYESWARLEEEHGDYAAANNVYSRAASAFPKDWNLLIRWARHQAEYDRIDRARTLFELACDIAGSSNAKPYRLYAEFEMTLENYGRARSILFLGAQSLSESSDGSLHNDEFARLYHSWAVCEWHLDNLDRAEVLFDHGLRLTDSTLGSETRSLILYSISRFLFHARNDDTLAQHCVSISLAENAGISENPDVWMLWSDVAKRMFNSRLSQQCLNQVRQLGQQDSSSLFLAADVNNHKMNHMLRRAPWQYKIRKSSNPNESSWYNGVRFPMPPVSSEQDGDN